MNGRPPVPIVFNYQTWVGMFPTFAAVSEPLAQGYFDLAELYYANCGWTAAIPKAATYLNLLTAHVAWLLAPRDGNGNPASAGQPASALVGRISSAGQGSVNVQIELEPSGSPSEAFFTQTQWGLMFWNGTASYRTARYMPGPRRGPNGVFPYGLGPYAPYGWPQ